MENINYCDCGERLVFDERISVLDEYEINEEVEKNK